MIKLNYASMSENELMTATAIGDQAAFSILYTRYRRMLYQYAYSKIRDTEIVEDMLQDLFSKIWHGREKLTDISNFSAYIYKVLKHQIIDFFLHQQHVRRFNAFAAKTSLTQRDTDHRTREGFFLDRIYDLINDSVPQGKEIFRLRIVEDLKSEDVGILLGLSEKTVRNRLSIILRLLRDRLEVASVFFIILNGNYTEMIVF